MCSLRRSEPVVEVRSPNSWRSIARGFRNTEQVPVTVILETRDDIRSSLLNGRRWPPILARTLVRTHVQPPEPSTSQPSY